MGCFSLRLQSMISTVEVRRLPSKRCARDLKDILVFIQRKSIDYPLGKKRRHVTLLQVSVRISHLSEVRVNVPPGLMSRGLFWTLQS